MKKTTLSVSLFSLLLFVFNITMSLPALAQGVTPMDTPLPEGKETLISVTYGENKIPFHYRVYIPVGYNSPENAKRPYPVIFISSPSGKAKMGNMANWLKKNEFIVIMLIEAKNGPWDPILRNFLSAYNDAVERLRIEATMMFGTGMSGGARATGWYNGIVGRACKTHAFAGMVLQGAVTSGNPKNDLVLKALPSTSVAVVMGKKDPNAREIAIGAKTILPPTRYKAFMFDGGHKWGPEKTVSEALEWVYQRALQNPQRKPSPGYLFWKADFLWQEAQKVDNVISYGAKLEEVKVKLRLVGRVAKKGKVADATKELTEKVDAELKRLRTVEAYSQEKLAASRFFSSLQSYEKSIASMESKGAKEADIIDRKQRAFESFKRSFLEREPESMVAQLAKREMYVIKKEIDGEPVPTSAELIAMFPIKRTGLPPGLGSPIAVAPATTPLSPPEAGPVAAPGPATLTPATAQPSTRKPTAKLIQTFTLPELPIALATNRQGRVLAQLSEAANGTTITVYLIPQLTVFSQWTVPEKLNKLCLSGTGSTLAASGKDAKSVYLYNVPKKELIKKLDGGSAALAISPNEKVLLHAPVSGKSVKLTILPTGVDLFSLAGHGATISQLAWNVAGSAFASADTSGKIIVWNPKEKKQDVKISLDAGTTCNALFFCAKDTRLWVAGNKLFMSPLKSSPHAFKLMASGEAPFINATLPAGINFGVLLDSQGELTLFDGYSGIEIQNLEAAIPATDKGTVKHFTCMENAKIIFASTSKKKLFVLSVTSSL